MKQITFLKSFFLLCALIVGSMNVWADDYEPYYTMTCTHNSSNTTYANYYDVTINEMTWNAPGNQNQGSGWRIGGKRENSANLDNDRFITGKTEMGSAISKIAFNHEGKSRNEVSVAYVKVTIASDEDFADVIDEVTVENPSITKGTAATINFTPSSPLTEWAKDCYYKFTIHVKNTSTSNGGLDVTSIVFYKTVASKTATTTNINYAGLTNTDLKNGTAAGSLSASVTVTDGGATVSGATVKWSSDDEDVAKVNETSGVVTLVGVGSATITASYEGDATYAASTDTYELTVTDTRTATVTTIDDSSITNTDLKNGTAAGTLTASVTAGGDPVLGATVTWESSDPTVATITDGGVVTLVKVGTTTITASYAGGGSYAASSNTYELTVVDSRQPVSISITNWNTLFNTTYNGSINDNDWPDDSKSLSGEINNVSVTYAKATGSYGYLRDDDLRLYGGTTLAFTAPTNYVITKIVFNANISDAKTAIADVGTFTTSTKTWEGKASSITLTGYIENTGYAKFVSATITLARKLEVAFEDGWMSYVTPCNIEFPEDVEAYVVTSIESGITREKIDEAPEGTPVILHATDGTGVYALTVPESATAPVKNELKASDGSITIDDDNYRKIYVLTVVSNQAGFGPLKKGNTLAAGKAYIEYATAQARDFFAFDSETTGIAKVAVEATDNIDANAPMYNLAGQRVTKSYKGVVIVNGKKMLNK